LKVIESGCPAAAFAGNDRDYQMQWKYRLFVMGLAIVVLSSGLSRRACGTPATAPDSLAATTDANLSTRPTGDWADAIAAEQSARLRIEQVSADLVAVREILSIGLASDDAGEMLRDTRRRTPDPDAAQQRVVLRQRQIARARLDQIRLQQQLRLTDDPAAKARLTAQLTAQDGYLAALQRALAAERQLATDSSELVRLLDARLIWIGSAPPVGPRWIADVAKGAAWLGNPLSWIQTSQTLLGRMWQNLWATALISLFFAALLLSSPLLQKRLTELAKGVGTYSTDSFLLTLRAAAVTVLSSLAFPMALAFLGWLLSTQSANLFARAVGSGLLTGAAVWLLLGFFRRICLPSGLADAHFTWNADARRTLANNLGWLIAVEVPCAFVSATCDAGIDEANRQGLGRLAFLVGSVGLTLFMARVFRPGTGVFAGLLSRMGWAWKIRKIIYLLIVILPGSLTLAAMLGYYYTATEVLGKFFTSGVVLLAGIVLHSILARWLRVTRQRLAVRQARQKLAEQREARQKRNEAEAADDAPGEAVPELEPHTLDIAAASDQTLLLLRMAVAAGVLIIGWEIWKNLVPALAVLDRVQLTKPALDAGGNVLVDPVTLWSLLQAVLVIALTVVAARSLPAVFELLVLHRFQVDAGVRYAAATLTRYAVIAAGIVIVSHLLGIDWSRAQWIIAALGVGLGFGLQEIVANFVSGLIILFERPVRVGDTVTVGDVSGTVSRLQIRATTITDWDNREVLVPNKSFITDRVVNWTLSNSIIRLIVRVGVAYGTDVEKAQAIIVAAVQRVNNILDEPAPSVLFLGFGDSSLDFEIRVFISELSKRYPTLHDLHVAVNVALERAGIEIPFPQRDLHLRSCDIGLPGLARDAKVKPPSQNGGA
jgi:potassium efflux system protein